MADSHALRLMQDSQRFSIGNVHIGDSQRLVLEQASAQLKQEPECHSRKVANSRNKMASSEQTCIFVEPQGIEMSGQKVLKIIYFFLDAHLQQMDIELEAGDDGSMEKIATNLSTNLNLKVEKQGTMSKWVGARDAVLMVKQGTIQIRIVPLDLLEENTQGNKVMHRS